jgi:hypothetical protein
LEKLIPALKKLGNATIGILAFTPIIGQIILISICNADDKNPRSQFVSYILKRVSV